MLTGWTTKTAKELDATIRTWGEIFGRYDIPADSYSELYLRAFDVRQSKIQHGKEPLTMDAALLVSCWTGEHGLKKEIEQRRIKEGRTLPDAAQAACQYCYGTGRRIIERDGYSGVISCDHKPIETLPLE